MATDVSFEVSNWVITLAASALTAAGGFILAFINRGPAMQEAISKQTATLALVLEAACSASTAAQMLLAISPASWTAGMEAGAAAEAIRAAIEAALGSAAQAAIEAAWTSAMICWVVGAGEKLQPARAPAQASAMSFFMAVSLFRPGKR
ncbi:hypothetical protein M2322_002832 [Rhodoblastus acidophilus]|uniref:hypothetical protein n=1 Tax=Rhodoblastus acidophilus TaxID=1074 RepID=UPI002225B1CC|nr:hypothetical protein [Rhodoblastus acidophilus]MCW2317273.1 hypothetical protein [Rhodoblastus acidophilus]